MSTADLKSHLHQLIDGITDNSVLQAVHTLLSKTTNNSDWWDELSIESKETIEEGLKDIKNGNTHTSKDVSRSIRQRIENKSA